MKRWCVETRHPIKGLVVRRKLFRIKLLAKRYMARKITHYKEDGWGVARSTSSATLRVIYNIHDDAVRFIDIYQLDY